jgi:hypothetical protein
MERPAAIAAPRRGYSQSRRATSCPLPSRGRRKRFPGVPHLVWAAPQSGCPHLQRAAWCPLRPRLRPASPAPPHSLSRGRGKRFPRGGRLVWTAPRSGCPHANRAACYPFRPGPRTGLPGSPHALSRGRWKRLPGVRHLVRAALEATTAAPERRCPRPNGAALDPPGPRLAPRQRRASPVQPRSRSRRRGYLRSRARDLVLVWEARLAQGRDPSWPVAPLVPARTRTRVPARPRLRSGRPAPVGFLEAVPAR